MISPESSLEEEREKKRYSVGSGEKVSVRALGAHASTPLGGHMPLCKLLFFLTCRVKMPPILLAFHPTLHLTKM